MLKPNQKTKKPEPGGREGERQNDTLLPPVPRTGRVASSSGGFTSLLTFLFSTSTPRIIEI